MTDDAKVRADADLVAETVAWRCSTGTKKDGSPSAPTRHAIIWQAARLGALEYAKLTQGDAHSRNDAVSADPSTEIERLHRLVDAYRLAAVYVGWNWPMARAYGHQQYLHDRIIAVDDNARRTIASGYDAAAYLRDGLAGGSK